MADEMKIRTLRTIKPPETGGASIGPGIVVTLPTAVAKRYVERGEATPVETPDTDHDAAQTGTTDDQR